MQVVDKVLIPMTIAEMSHQTTQTFLGLQRTLESA